MVFPPKSFSKKVIFPILFAFPIASFSGCFGAGGGGGSTLGAVGGPTGPGGGANPSETGTPSGGSGDSATTTGNLGPNLPTGILGPSTDAITVDPNSPIVFVQVAGESTVRCVGIQDKSFKAFSRGSPLPAEKGFFQVFIKGNLQCKVGGNPFQDCGDAANNLVLRVLDKTGNRYEDTLTRHGDPDGTNGYFEYALDLKLYSDEFPAGLEWDARVAGLGFYLTSTDKSPGPYNIEKSYDPQSLMMPTFIWRGPMFKQINKAQGSDYADLPECPPR